MPANSKHFYDFGPYRVDARERLLRCGDKVVPLTPKAFDVLLVLLQDSGHVLTKEELMKRVWPDTIVEEANLSHNIYKLREALGEGRNGEKYIETLPRRGYRFVAKVREVGEQTVDLIVAEHTRAQLVVEEDDASDKVIEPGSGIQGRVFPQNIDQRRLSIPKAGLLAAGCIALIGLVAGSAYVWRSRQSRMNLNGAGLHSIAVLPFKPLAANDRDESLEMGMADTLITRLSSIGQLTVRPTSAVRQYTKLEDEALNQASGRDGLES